MHTHTTHTLPWSGLPWGVERPWQQATPNLANEYRSPRCSQQLGPWEPQRPSGSLRTQNESGLLYMDAHIIKIATTVYNHQSYQQLYRFTSPYSVLSKNEMSKHEVDISVNRVWCGRLYNVCNVKSGVNLPSMERLPSDDPVLCAGMCSHACMFMSAGAHVHLLLCAGVI